MCFSKFHFILFLCKLVKRKNTLCFFFLRSLISFKCMTGQEYENVCFTKLVPFWLFFSGNGEGNLWFLKSSFHVVSFHVVSKSGLWCPCGTWSVESTLRSYCLYGSLFSNLPQLNSKSLFPTSTVLCLTDCCWLCHQLSQLNCLKEFNHKNAKLNELLPL